MLHRKPVISIPVNSNIETGKEPPTALSIGRLKKFMDAAASNLMKLLPSASSHQKKLRFQTARRDHPKATKTIAVTKDKDLLIAAHVKSASL